MHEGTLCSLKFEYNLSHSRTYTDLKTTLIMFRSSNKRTMTSRLSIESHISLVAIDPVNCQLQPMRCLQFLVDCVIDGERSILQITLNGWHYQFLQKLGGGWIKLCTINLKHWLHEFTFDGLHELLGIYCSCFMHRTHAGAGSHVWRICICLYGRRW